MDRVVVELSGGYGSSSKIVQVKFSGAYSSRSSTIF